MRNKSKLTSEEKIQKLRESCRKWYYSKPKSYHAERMRKWRSENPIKEMTEEQKIAHREKSKLRMREYRRKLKEKDEIEFLRKQKEQNKRSSYSSNKEYNRERMRLWRAKKKLEQNKS